MSNIKQYLEQLSTMPSNIGEFYKWVLANGKFFSKRLPVKRFGKEKQCFYNSQTACLFEGEDYYEGWGTLYGLPLDHGFNVRNDTVIDRTWRNASKDTEYFGVKIPKEFIRKHWFKTSMAENMLYRYYQHIKGRKK
jgi:hypothetical protein